MNNDSLYDTCFYGLQDPKIWGYSTKRIRVSIPGTITDHVVCSGYGFKDKNNILYVEIRLWIDQGNYTYKMIYNSNKLIVSHFAELVRQHHNKFKIQILQNF